MASPLDIERIKDKNKLYIPKNINLAINLIQAFITNNNPLGLKIAILLSGAKEQIEYDEDNGVTFEVNELCHLCKIDRRYLSNHIERTTKTFFKYVDLEGNVGGTHPLHSYKYLNKAKYIRIEISSQAKKLFTELRKKGQDGGYQYTRAISRNLMIYDLKDVNKHTVKMQLLLEMINNFTHTKRKVMSLEELNGYFGTNYKRYIDFKNKILEPVKKDTLKYSTVSFDYTTREDIPKSTKITGITIDIIDNSNLFTDERFETKINSPKKSEQYLKKEIELLKEGCFNLNEEQFTLQDIVTNDENIYIAELIKIYDKTKLAKLKLKDNLEDSLEYLKTFLY